MRHAIMILLLLLAGVTAAPAQLFNPNTPAGPAPILPMVPPAAQPGFNPQPPPVANDSRSNPLGITPSIGLGRSAQESFNDRSTRCVQQGGQLGVPSGAMGRYVGECVNSP